MDEPEFVDELPTKEPPWFPWMRAVYADPEGRWARVPTEFLKSLDGIPFFWGPMPEGVRMDERCVSAPGCKSELFMRRATAPPPDPDPDPEPGPRRWRRRR